MALNDVQVISGEGPVMTFDVEDRNTSGLSATIKAGDPVKVGGTGSNFVTLLATGDPEIGTDRFVGIAVNESTETATADGSMDVMVPIPGKTIMRCKATTVANVDTAAEALGLRNDCVTFDLTGSIFTVDEDEGSDPDVHGLVIVDAEVTDGWIYFTMQERAGLSGGSVT